MLLSQLSTVQGNGANVLADILDKSQFVRLAQFREDGTDYLKHPVDEKSEPAFRAMSGSYTPESDDSQPNLGQLKFLGKEATIDQSYKIDAQKGLTNLDMKRARYRKRHAKALAKGIDKVTFAGTGAGNEIIGFSSHLDGSNVSGFSDTMVIDADSSDELDLTTESNWDSFMELMDDVLVEVPDATMIAVNKELKAKINTIGRNTHALGQSQDAFGRPVTTFNGVPIVRLADGAIPNNEIDGASTDNNTTSLYVIRFEEVDGVCLPSNSGLRFKDFEETEDNVTEKMRMELYYDIDIEAPDAIRRVRYLRATA